MRAVGCPTGHKTAAARVADSSQAASCSRNELVLFSVTVDGAAVLAGSSLMSCTLLSARRSRSRERFLIWRVKTLCFLLPVGRIVSKIVEKFHKR
jgi:hypothetical protein